MDLKRAAEGRSLTVNSAGRGDGPRQPVDYDVAAAFQGYSSDDGSGRENGDDDAPRPTTAEVASPAPDALDALLGAPNMPKGAAPAVADDDDDDDVTTVTAALAADAKMEDAPAPAPDETVAAAQDEDVFDLDAKVEVANYSDQLKRLQAEVMKDTATVATINKLLSNIHYPAGEVNLARNSHDMVDLYYRRDDLKKKQQQRKQNHSVTPTLNKTEHRAGLLAEIPPRLETEYLARLAAAVAARNRAAAAAAAAKQERAALAKTDPTAALTLLLRWVDDPDRLLLAEPVGSGECPLAHEARTVHGLSFKHGALREAIVNELGRNSTVDFHKIISSFHRDKIAPLVDDDVQREHVHNLQLNAAADFERPRRLAPAEAPPDVISQLVQTRAAAAAAPTNPWGCHLGAFTPEFEFPDAPPRRLPESEWTAVQQPFYDSRDTPVNSLEEIVRRYRTARRPDRESSSSPAAK